MITANADLTALPLPAALPIPLYEARRTRVPIDPFTDADPSLGLADGYAIQQELIKLLRADGDEIIGPQEFDQLLLEDRKSTRLNSSHANISYALFCLEKRKKL